MATVHRKGQLPAQSRPAQGGFTGPAVQHPLLEQSEPKPVRVSFVSFEAGSRTHWHTHSGGQVLHVVEGSGLTQAEGGSVETIGPGDVVTAAPGEKHWHGAADEAPMRHLAVTIGEVSWFEAPTVFV